MLLHVFFFFTGLEKHFSLFFRLAALSVSFPPLSLYLLIYLQPGCLIPILTHFSRSLYMYVFNHVSRPASFCCSPFPYTASELDVFLSVSLYYANSVHSSHSLVQCTAQSLSLILLLYSCPSLVLFSRPSLSAHFIFPVYICVSLILSIQCSLNASFFLALCLAVNVSRPFPLAVMLFFLYSFHHLSFPWPVYLSVCLSVSLSLTLYL